MKYRFTVLQVRANGSTSHLCAIFTAYETLTIYILKPERVSVLCQLTWKVIGCIVVFVYV